jgi:hypothetical protein
MSKASDQEVCAAFAELVNMTALEIAQWHATKQSACVGQDAGDGVSIGVKAGRATIALLRAKRAPDASALKYMRRVVGFIRRQQACAPARDRARSRWRYALMNWGHDPLKPNDRDSPWRN